MAEENEGDEAKQLQAKLDDLDIATLQQLLQTAIANKTGEATKDDIATPVTPSTTPTEALHQALLPPSLLTDQSVNNEAEKVGENQETTDADGDSSEVEINVEVDVKNQVIEEGASATNDDLAQNIFPDNQDEHHQPAATTGTNIYYI